MKMNDSVKYQLQRAEDALRTALKFADQESVYVISAISKALIEIDNTMFTERIQNAAKKNDPIVSGLYSFDKQEQEDGTIKFDMSYINSRVKGGWGDDHISFNGYNYVYGSNSNDVITFS